MADVAGASAPTADPLAQAVAALAAVGAMGSTPRAVAPAAGLAPADVAWLDRLATLRLQTQGRWAPAEPMPEGAGEAIVDRSGRPLGRLLLQPERVLWQDAEGRTWQAPRPAAAAPAAPPSR